MESDNIHSIFNNFQPRLATSDECFMAQLERNIRAAEVVKQQIVKGHVRNRLAIILASATSFILGVLITLCYPFIQQFALILSVREIQILDIPDYYITTGILTILGLLILLVSYTVYDFTRTVTIKKAEVRK